MEENSQFSFCFSGGKKGLADITTNKGNGLQPITNQEFAPYLKV